MHITTFILWNNAMILAFVLIMTFGIFYLGDTWWGAASAVALLSMQMPDETTETTKTVSDQLSKDR